MEIGLIKGFRIFEASGKNWRGPFSRCHWFMAINEAGCSKALAHAYGAPEEECTCGIYGYSYPEDAFNLRDRQNQASLVVAAVVGWGRTLLHSHLWRSQFAPVIAICSGEKESDLASRYFNVPCLDENEFLNYANERGVEIFKGGIPGLKINRIPLQLATQDYASLLLQTDQAMNLLEANIPAAKAEIEIIAARMGRRLIGEQWRELQNMALYLQQEMLTELRLPIGSWERRVGLLQQESLTDEEISRRLRCSVYLIKRSLGKFAWEDSQGDIAWG